MHTMVCVAALFASCQLLLTSCDKADEISTEQEQIMVLAPQLKEYYLRSCELQDKDKDAILSFVREYETFCTDNPLARLDTVYHPRIKENILGAIHITIQSTDWDDTVKVGLEF